MGGFSIIVLEDMKNKEIEKLTNQIKELENVEKVISMADVIGTNIPVEMIPDEIKGKAYKDGSTLMLVTFKEAISSDQTMETVQKLREMTDQRCKISGMTATLLDTRDLANSEIAICNYSSTTMFISFRNCIRFICNTSYFIIKYRNSNFI